MIDRYLNAGYVLKYKYYFLTYNYLNTMLKILIILVFLSIVASLGIALFHLIRNKESSEKTVKALTYRISISLALFILLTIALMSGLIQPAGIGMQMQLQKEKIAEQQNN